jgi:HEPN domain-containing protein
MKVDFLKKRAESFLRNAKDLIRKEEYHLAAFNLEQSAQLYLKYYLYIKLKDFPKIHSLDELLVDLGKTYKKEREIEKLKKDNIHLIADLDQAYITARYLPVEFSKTQVEQMRKFVENLIKFLRKL